MKEDLNSRQGESYKSSAAQNAAEENAPIISSPITRRRFLKRTGGAGVATVLALHGLSNNLIAVEESSGSAEEWKKRKWECKIACLGPSDTPYDAQQCEDAEDDWNDAHPGHWTAPPMAPPTGGYYLSGPTTIVNWDPSRPPHIITFRTREPTPPTVTSWKNPADGKYYAVFLYDYIEEQQQSDPVED